MAPPLRFLQLSITLCFIVLFFLTPLSTSTYPERIRKSLHFNIGTKLERTDIADEVRYALLSDMSLISIECIMIPLLYLLFRSYASVWISISCLLRFVQVVILAGGGIGTYIGMLLQINQGTAADEDLITYLTAHRFGNKLAFGLFYGLHCLSLGYLVTFKLGDGFFNSLKNFGLPDSSEGVMSNSVSSRASSSPKSFNIFCGLLLLLSGLAYLIDGIIVSLLLFDEYETHPGKLWTAEAQNKSMGEKAVFYQDVSSALGKIGSVGFFMILGIIGVNRENYDLKRRRVSVGGVSDQEVVYNFTS